MEQPCSPQIPKNQLGATFWRTPPPHGEWSSWFLFIPAADSLCETFWDDTLVAVCTWGKAEARHGSAKSTTRPACLRLRPCLLSTLTEWATPKTERVERQEAAVHGGTCSSTPANLFLGLLKHYCLHTEHHGYIRWSLGGSGEGQDIIWLDFVRLHVQPWGGEVYCHAATKEKGGYILLYLDLLRFYIHVLTQMSFPCSWELFNM